jgi:hypothetical protein
MPDLGGVMGPFRITTVLDSAHGGYFSFDSTTADASLTYIAGNTAIFRSTTRFVWSSKNATAAALVTNQEFYLTCADDGEITLTFDGAGPGGSGGGTQLAEFYFIVFNGGTKYTLD